MSSSFAVRLGAVAGWFTFVAVLFGLIVIPTAIAGEPPITADEAAVRAFFGHPEIAVLFGLVNAFITVAVVPFGLGLRAAIRSGATERIGALSDVAFALLLVTSAAYLVSGAIGAALVEVVRAGGDVGALARVYQILYNGAADVLEGAWIGAFGLAMIGTRFPRWLTWLAIAVAISRWVKALIPFVALPAIVVPASGVLFVAFFFGLVVTLSAIALRREVTTAPLAAPA